MIHRFLLVVTPFIITPCGAFSYSNDLSYFRYTSTSRLSLKRSIGQRRTASPSSVGVIESRPLSSSPSPTLLFSASTSSSQEQRQEKQYNTNNYKGLNRKNTRKKQKENEIQLQSLSKSGGAHEALKFYHSIRDEYEAESAILAATATEEKLENSDTDSKEIKALTAVPPTVRLMNYAIDACARARPKPLTDEALNIFAISTASSSKSKENKNQTQQPLIPNVYTFGSLIRAFARIGDVKKCRQILKEMKHEYHIIPNSVIYSTIISACENVNSNGKNNEYDNNNANGIRGRSSGVGENFDVDVKQALNLFQEAIATGTDVHNNKRVDMNIVVYNTMLSILAKAGEWRLACQLLDEMSGCDCAHNDATTSTVSTVSSSQDSSQTKNRIVPLGVNIPPPDRITYGTVMAACERAKQWTIVLKIAERVNKDDRYQLDGVSLSSALKACQQLGLADEALEYLNQMKKLRTNSSGKEQAGDGSYNDYRRRKPLQGPDDVAYRLAISACARSKSNIGNGNSNTNYLDGIRLLREMEEVTGSSPDVIAYTAAIGGCAVAGEYKRAIKLLKEMKIKGVEPNVVTFTAVISACASACAKKFSDDEVDSVNDFGNDRNSDDRYESGSSIANNDQFIKGAAMKAALSILAHMTRENASPDIQPNIVTYNAAIRACAEGLDVGKAFALLDELKSRNLQPTIVTFGTLMTACERIGDTKGATKVFRIMKDANIKPNEIVYGAAISCFRKASQSERTFRLIHKMMDEKLSPNTATFNTVIMSQIETKNINNAMNVYQMMTEKESSSSQYGKPNRQTYDLLIQSMAKNSEPSKAAYLLQQMRENGMKPDVDLFTATVTSYEKNKEPRKALSLMESMREEGYDFYDIKVLDVAFKQGVRVINNIVGNGQDE